MTTGAAITTIAGIQDLQDIFVQIANIQPDEHVLDLACGTGLITFLAARAVGVSGSVVGIDLSPGMLHQASRKEESFPLHNVTLYQHSITDLVNLDEIKNRQFDVSTCASALVLLQDPAGALKEWVQFLKPGGRLIVDVTHPSSHILGMTFERVGALLDRPVSYHRAPFQTPEDLQSVMMVAGLQDVDVKALSQMIIASDEDLESYLCDARNPKVHNVYNVIDADADFESAIQGPMIELLASPDIREQVKHTFMQEWTKLADEDGRIEEVDCVFVGMGRKPVKELK